MVGQCVCVWGACLCGDGVYLFVAGSLCGLGFVCGGGGGTVCSRI